MDYSLEDTIRLAYAVRGMLEKNLSDEDRMGYIKLWLMLKLSHKGQKAVKAFEGLDDMLMKWGTPKINPAMEREWQIRQAVNQCKIHGGGQARQFSKLTGIITNVGTTDSRLWKGYRQSESPDHVRDADNKGEDKGDYP